MTVLELLFLLLNFIISVAGLSAFALAATVTTGDNQQESESEVIEWENINIINLTPHDVNLHLASGEVVTYPPLNKDNPARAAMDVKKIANLRVHLQAVPVTRNKYGELENVPEPQANTLFIVSALAAQAAPWREDLIIPSDPVRGEGNKIIGCRGFSVI